MLNSFLRQTDNVGAVRYDGSATATETKNLIVDPEREQEDDYDHINFFFNILGLADDDKAHLRGWKRLCDDLLPALRARGHLHNLIFRARANASLVLVQHGDAIGGVTFRMIHDEGDDAGAGRGGSSSRSTVLDVLLLAVAQRPGVCG